MISYHYLNLTSCLYTYFSGDSSAYTGIIEWKRLIRQTSADGQFVIKTVEEDFHDIEALNRFTKTTDWSLVIRNITEGIYHGILRKVSWDITEGIIGYHGISRRAYNIITEYHWTFLWTNSYSKLKLCSILRIIGGRSDMPCKKYFCKIGIHSYTLYKQRATFKPMKWVISVRGKTTLIVLPWTKMWQHHWILNKLVTWLLSTFLCRQVANIRLQHGRL